MVMIVRLMILTMQIRIEINVEIRRGKNEKREHKSFDITLL